MKIKYDRDADVLSIETTPGGTIDHAEHTGPFIAHFGTHDELVLLEILNASDVLSELIKASLRDQDELAPTGQLMHVYIYRFLVKRV